MASTPLVFPESGNTAFSDMIKFDFFEYAPAYSSGTKVGQSESLDRYNSSATSGGSGGALALAKDLSTIWLPMPTDIGSKYAGKWDGQDLTTIMSGVLGAMQGVGKIGGGNYNQATTSMTTRFKDLGKTAVGVGGEQLYRLAANEINKVPGLGSNLTANDLLSLGTSSIINPNTELLYGGTSLRTHGYSFKLIPQRKEDSTTIKNIVQTFRKAILPKKAAVSKGSAFGFAGGANFIGIPDVCKVSYMTKSASSYGENTWLPNYKTSAITALDVSYVTDSQYQTYNDAAPLGIQLTVAFTELKLLFREDIGPDKENYR